jgi:hypothetical protein
LAMMRRPRLVALCALIGCGRMGMPELPAPDASAVAGDAAACNPPDVLVLLDRTASMAERPNGTFPANTAAGHTESKWFIAIDAIEQLSAQMEASVRFGLALFPRAPVSEACITLAERISGARASNPQCETGEVLVPPASASAVAIESTLDPETTRLCTSTPIGAGLATARTQLASTREAGRPQYVLFVGDGADTCDAELALANTDALARDGVKTFVVAFDDGASPGIDRGLLNDMACAGQTAAGFPAGCAEDEHGNFRAVDRAGAELFLAANNGSNLTGALEQIAQSVCCGCIL